MLRLPPAQRAGRRGGHRLAQLGAGVGGGAGGARAGLFTPRREPGRTLYPALASCSAPCWQRGPHKHTPPSHPPTCPAQAPAPATSFPFARGHAAHTYPRAPAWWPAPRSCQTSRPCPAGRPPCTSGPGADQTSARRGGTGRGNTGPRVKPRAGSRTPQEPNKRWMRRGAGALCAYSAAQARLPQAGLPRAARSGRACSRQGGARQGREPPYPIKSLWHASKAPCLWGQVSSTGCTRPAGRASGRTPARTPAPLHPLHAPLQCWPA